MRSKPELEELRRRFFAAHDQLQLKAWQNSCVGIAGAGGLGSNVAVALTRAGVGKLVIVDYDVLSVSNLNRQQYFMDQVGQSKVIALKDNLTRVSPFSMIVTHALRITPDNLDQLFGHCDILIEAFDLADQKTMLIESWQELHPDKPIIAASGLAGVGNNQAIITSSCDGLYLIGDQSSELQPGISPVSARVAIVANMQANLCLELLLQISRTAK